ncbi:hypothetical protein CNR22_03750 [Sphingobacteriaceae bacterium]|nr:hypothetical protein CNR22_03750 [Sphingobacteriaceae bacterium]
MKSMVTPHMSKAIPTTLSLLLLTGMIVSLTSMTSVPDSIVGKWESADKEYTWEFFKGGESYFAKLITSNDALEPDGKTFKKDVKNSDQKLKNRSLQGIIFVFSLKYNDGAYTDGKIYAFSDGNLYDCKATVEGNKLYFRAYKGVSILGKTIEFNHVK